ncbi:Hypothetical predicted protein [Scomber scombrus]|uniref:Secreted protein n=1 Tax=Scomber scombrus TaxID=13677 RepID=A0AAV1NST3_SCOSC
MELSLCSLQPKLLASIALISLRTQHSLGTECSFPWKINKERSGGSLEKADEKKHGSERRSSVDPAHL